MMGKFGRSRTTLAEQDLQPGDVLLYSGDSLIARLIQIIDGTEVSHAGLYLGKGRVGEALITTNGLTTQSLSISVQDSNVVKVVRHSMSDQGDAMEPVIQKAKCILLQGARYAYGQIFLLAFVCAARRMDDVISNFVFRNIAQKAIDGATKLIEQLRSENREPMICSEFVYRAFDEALPQDQDRYAIQIGTHADIAGAPQRRTRSLRKQTRGNNLLPFSAIEPGSLLDSVPMQPDEVSEPMPSPEYTFDELKQELENLAQQYFEEREIVGSRFASASSSLEDDNVFTRELERSAHFFASQLVASELLACDSITTSPSQKITPDFVTPGDLFKSPSFVSIGDLRL